MALIFLRKNKETLSAINSDGKQLNYNLLMKNGNREIDVMPKAM